MKTLKIKRIKKINNDSKLYDIETKKNHNFYANDILVHNSCIVKGGVYARSHATFTESPWSRYVRDVHARIGHQLDEETYIFGEGMGGIHSIEYKGLSSYFYVFGVRVGNEWLSWDDVCLHADMLELPTVPVLARGTFADIKTEVEKHIIQPSTLKGLDTVTQREEMEGVVVRNVECFTHEQSYLNLLKWVRAGHVNTGDHWSKNWKPHKLINGFY